MTNPYTAGTPAFDEYAQWERGAAAGGYERDFLRAFHRHSAVTSLRDRLASSCTSAAKVRVSSIWIDKYPIAIPRPPHAASLTPREIGDLAIVVRRSSPGRLDQRMWIVQAKVERPSWRSTGSSPKEIDLLENCPAFDLHSSSSTGSTKLGSFDLRKDFGPPPYRGQPFWSYLMFADKNNQSSPLAPSHASAIWPNTMRYASGICFYECVERQFAATRTPLTGAFGARVDCWTPYPTWRRLYRTLLMHVHSKLPSRLSGGPWHVSAWPVLGGPLSIGPLGDGTTATTTGFGKIESTLAPEALALRQEDLRLGVGLASMWAEQVPPWQPGVDAPNGPHDAIYDRDNEEPGFGVIIIDSIDRPDPRDESRQG